MNCVAPTFIRTPGTRPALADADFERHVLDMIPLGRIGEVEDVTGAVTFLCSPAARMITGATCWSTEDGPSNEGINSPKTSL